MPITIVALLNSLQTKLCTSTLCRLAAHVVHVIVAPQNLTVNIQRRNFFIYSLRHSAAVVQFSSSLVCIEKLSLQILVFRVSYVICLTELSKS